jgi:hypothetical protein
MPGALADLSVRTGYPIPEVVKQIGNLRREGVRVMARMGEPFFDDEGHLRFWPTIYEIPLDTSSREE